MAPIGASMGSERLSSEFWKVEELEMNALRTFGN